MTLSASTQESEDLKAEGPAEELRGLARRAHHHFKNKTTDQAASPLQLSVDAYLDEERFERELNGIFTQLPLGLALSIELPDAGSYLARTVCKKPEIGRAHV